MSSSASQSRKPNRRVNSLQNNDRLQRNTSRLRPKVVSYNESYTFALRAAFLHHLLQPRPKKKQYLDTPKPGGRSSSSIGELVSDFSLFKDTKSAKLPHGFMGLLEVRLQGVIVSRERLPGFKDPAVKRTFAEAYTAFTEAGFRKQMEKERRVEDLVLIFYSKANKALQKGKAPEDESWKGMVDRHVALFVRILSSTLRDNGNDRDRPELMSRLATLENKLLTEDQDLTVSGKDAWVDVPTPISYDVKDMVMVQAVTRIFGLRNSQVQSDIDANRNFWTEEAALNDLKSYQACLNANSKRTLRSDNFDLDEGYQVWKKAEGPDLQQLILDIIHIKPELAKSSLSSLQTKNPNFKLDRPNTPLSAAVSNKPLPSIRSVPAVNTETPATDFLSAMSSPTTYMSSSALGFDQPVDMSGLTLNDDSSPLYLQEATFTFIPPDPRAYYRSILAHAMAFDQFHSDHPTNGPAVMPTLSKQSMELLTELGVRWRIPQFSRLVLFLDVASQKFMDQEIGLEELDTAFEFLKNPPNETKRSGTNNQLLGLPSFDQSLWTIQDFALYRQALVNIHDALLRDLYDVLQHCYESKPPSISPIMLILQNHIYNDPSFSESPEQLAEYSEQLEIGLRDKAASVYRGYLESEVPQNQEEWQFFHVVQLGKSVVKLCQRIQKRYSKTPSIMGVDPLSLLVETMFPSFENDAGDLIKRILEVAHAKDTEVDLQDGFDLYKELVEIRRIHLEALPGVPFAFHIEGVLCDFVWRWIRVADSRMTEMVDGAISHDKFEVRSANPSDNERNSVSTIDIFRLFNETTDQVFQLSWDDDVHHAKFMTALSKSFGIALARYCEVIEQRFTGEMNRLSPAQEALAGQTKQERWLQLARDAWNNKEKIEPFQFYPESLVKLNNIEYCIQQLDKLQKLMNMDACSEVLRKTLSAKEQQQKPSKYVFTIKIVEAENLKACDANGFSDPYVVLVDEFGKRLTKTRVVLKNLNPRWDESVDLTVQGSSAVNVVAMIWDSDLIGDDDYVGRTSLKLDPSHFGDYLPKEFWLNLDTQGRLLLRISMEGEKDDIQFYFGKAFRMLKRTEREMIRKITDKLSTFINGCLSYESLHALSSRGMSLANIWRSRQSVMPPLTPLDIENALKPLFTYFDENFTIMKQTLTNASMVLVMTRLWKEVLIAIEGILIPPLSDKPSMQKPVTQQELDIVHEWLRLLFEFFNHRDEETGEAMGVPSDVLMSPKWFELKSLPFFYFEPTENLIRESEHMASATAQRAQAQRNRFSAPANLGASFGTAGIVSTRRSKSIMLSRNLGTIKKAKEDKRREAQADPNDDLILRILRMRPEQMAAGYLRDRSRQKERLAAAAAADVIVRQSLLAGAGNFGSNAYGANNLPRR